MRVPRQRIVTGVGIEMQDWRSSRLTILRVAGVFISDFIPQLFFARPLYPHRAPASARVAALRAAALAAALVARPVPAAARVLAQLAVPVAARALALLAAPAPVPRVARAARALRVGVPARPVPAKMAAATGWAVA
jgi:hypothetical protein